MLKTTKPKRHGNDEMPTDRAAVKIIRTSRSVESAPTGLPQNKNSPTKQPVTKISKLVYEEKRQPTSAAVKSIHSHRNASESGKQATKQIPGGASRPDVNQMRSQTNRKSGAVEKSTSGRQLPTDQSTLETSFVQKRIERQKEIDGIHDILQGLSQHQDDLEAGTVSASASQENISDMPSGKLKETAKPVSTTKRCKTDPELVSSRSRSVAGSTLANSDPRRSGATTVRSKSSTRSTETNADVNPSTKQKSYNPQKARQFMQEQRERRKALGASTKNAVTQVEREEIKKRLDNLRKNTLAIIQKNVKRVRRKSVDLPANPITNRDDSSNSAKQPKPAQSHESVPAPVVDVSEVSPVLPNTPEKLSSEKEKNAGSEAGPSKPVETPNLNLPLKTANQPPRTPSVEKTPSLPSDFKKIGLLRKENSEPSSQIFTLEPFNFATDKENMLHVPSPKIPSPNCLPQTPKSQSISHMMMAPSSSYRKATIELEKPMPDLQLRVPDVKLKSRPTAGTKSVQAETPKKPSLPYWLQPTPVQVYPYNFIRAVRKKLEAITNPVQSGDEEKSVTNASVKKPMTPKQATLGASISHSATAVPFKRPLEFGEISPIDMESLRSRHKVPTDSSAYTPFLSSPGESPKKVAIALDHSEITSSITINMAPSDTVSEISSLHSDMVKQPIMSSTRVSKRSQRAARKNDDDTTAPSSVFSSPEKKLPIPRKAVDQSDGVNNPGTYSISKRSSDNTADTLSNISPLSVEKINNLNLRTKSASGPSKVEVKSREDFEQMLQDFNKSLSHVLEVNQQLHSAISKSPRSARSIAESIKSQHSARMPASRDCSSKSDNYSSDFEAAGSERSHRKKAPGSKDSSSRTIHTATSMNSIDIERKANTTSIVQSISRNDDAPSLSQTTAEENIKNISTHTENFHDSIEEASKLYPKSITSPAKEPNVTLNDSHNFSKDSLEPDKLGEIASPRKQVARDDVIRNQINFKRGDQYTYVGRDRHSVVASRQSDAKVLPSDDSISHRPILNSSMGSDIFAIFNQSEMEVSIISQSSIVSETHLNYSSLGLYEQLIKTESTKSEHLTALLKIREKSILDRTRGQIALLEIQKEKCKAKGLTVQISIIKRKQRAILLKMEKERDEIKRILKLSEKESKTTQKQTLPPPTPPILKIPDLTLSTNLSFRKSFISQPDQVLSDSRRVVKGYELDTSQSLETLLRERETELQRRRKHVESLLQWHQRLDEEEEEVLKIEQLLYKYNKQKRMPVVNDEVQTVHDRKKQKKLMDIDKSLRELQSISTTTTTATTGNETDSTEKFEKHFVRTSGRKLNKLWRRLTGHSDERFEPARRYKLSKRDLEELYEDAKRAVLEDFQQNDAVGVLTDQSKLNYSNNSVAESNSSKTTKATEIPHLNLNFSSAASDTEENNLDHAIDDKTRSASQSPKNASTASENQSSDTTIKTKETSEYTMNFTSSEGDVDTRLSVTVKTKVTMTSPKDDRAGVDDDLVDSNSAGVCEKQHSNESNDYTTPSSEVTNENDKNSSNNSSNTIESEIKHPDGKDISNLECDPKNSRSETSGAKTIDKSSEETSRNVNISSYLMLHNGYAQIPSCHNISLDKNDVSDIMIDDITVPKFETTVDDTKSIAEEFIFAGSPDKEVSNAANNGQSSVYDRFELPEDEEERPPSELERRLIDLDESLKELNNSFERVLSPDRSTGSSPPPLGHSVIDMKQNDFDVDDNKENRPQDSPSGKMTVKDYLLNPDATSNLMPDIINEVELRRRQQILVESDIIQLENAVPFALLREIPNKPPPPYVPPAHGSPMTTIFPSEARIKEITFRRTKELCLELNAEGTSSDTQPSILDENITNIYERIILDICKECVRDYQPTFTANSVHVGNYKMPLALYNPPNRLKCVQEFVYKRVRKLLNMDKQKPRVNSIFSLGRRKRDHVDEILIQELFEEEHKWNNFDLEEGEVRDSVIDEVFNELVKELIDDFEESYKQPRGEEKMGEDDSIG